MSQIELKISFSIKNDFRDSVRLPHAQARSQRPRPRLWPQPWPWAMAMAMAIAMAMAMATTIAILRKKNEGLDQTVFSY